MQSDLLRGEFSQGRSVEQTVLAKQVCRQVHNLMELLEQAMHQRGIGWRRETTHVAAAKHFQLLQFSHKQFALSAEAVVLLGRLNSRVGFGVDEQ